MKVAPPFYCRPIFRTLALIGLLLSGCNQEIDFDQTDELIFQNESVFNLIHTRVMAQDFEVDAGDNNPLFATETAAIAELQEPFIQNNLTALTLTVGCSNTMGKTIDARVVFTDFDGQVTYTVRLNIPASTGSPAIIEDTYVITGSDLEGFKQSRFVQLVLTLNDDAVSPPGYLDFKSKGRFRFEF